MSEDKDLIKVDQPTQSQEKAPEENHEKETEEMPPPEVMEAMKGFPKGVRQQILEMGAFHFGSTQSPFQSVLKKITPDHIHKFLDYSHKDEENNINLIKTGRKYPLIYTCIGVVFFSFLVIYLSQNNSQLLNEIVKYFAAFAGGFGGGYGVKSHFEKKK